MKTTNRIIHLAFMSGLLCGLGGCDSHPDPGRGSRSVSWSRAEPGKQAVPGIDHASVIIYTWGNDAAFVVWHDGTPSSSSSPPKQPGDGRGVRYEGSFGGIPVECFTPDGKTGEVKIGGERYELAHGSLFLLSTKGAKPKVKQLGLARLNLKPEGSLSSNQIGDEQLKEAAKIDAEIRAFFIEAAQ